MSGWRAPTGGLIDRTRPIAFSFDSRPLSGFEGDTIASALLAAGQRVIGRSFKLHRPRGLWGGWHDEPNALFDVTEAGRTTPNLRATTERLRPGLSLRSVNTWPDAAGDRLRFLDRLHRFLPAGFYYKTFMVPGWPRWEPMIRRMAGLGRLDPSHEPPPDAEQIHARCVFLVIGAGPAGLAAARAAAARGVSVWLVDDQDRPGGSLRWRGGVIDGAPWGEWVADTLTRIEAAGGRILSATTAWGVFDHGLIGLWQRGSDGADRLWRLRAGTVVLAAGAIERPLWFADNDLPGVMSADAALRHLRLHAAVCGRRIVVAGGNDGIYAVAAGLAGEGCAVTMLDARDAGPPAPDGVDLLRGHRVMAARGREGVRWVRAGTRRFQADTLLVSGGWTPSVHLFMQAGGRLDWDARADALVPRLGSAPMAVAGAAGGALTLDAALAQGHAAGGGSGPAPRAASGPGFDPAPLRPDPALPGRQWIDLQNDVTLKDVAIAAREGYTSVEHLKRYTTLGMATDQGRGANFAGLAAMAALTGRTIPEAGTTTYRPPFAPVPLTVLAGRRRGELFNPLRRLALEQRHRDAGARWRDYGGWLRPAHYGTDETHDAQHEAVVARRAVALYDASPLGKIEILGPDAAALLDFCFHTRLSTLAPGRARYALMLTEAGIVYDDGVTLKLAADRFVVSASSSHVAGVRLRLEDARQDRFDPARVVVHDVTGHWATLAVAGPAARRLLQEAGVPLDLDDAALPHMGVIETTWDARPLRVARISFTGERSYEVSVPLRDAAWLADRLESPLAALGGGWIGMEALMILRAEKGFILVGKDTDGVTMPHDLSPGGARIQRTDDHIGRRALLTAEALRDDRRQLVGLLADDGAVLPAGAHLVPPDGPRRSLGFVTSSHFSPVLARGIALALVEGGRRRIGENLGVFDRDIRGTARVVDPCAYDPAGTRLHV